MAVLAILLLATTPMGGIAAAPSPPPVPAASAPPLSAAARPAADSMAERLSEGEMGQLITRFTYIAIVGVLLLCGMGLPLPEEVPILTSGVLARLGHLSPWPALMAVLFGVMAGDSVMFLLGRRWGVHLLEHRLSRMLLTRERQAKIAVYFQKYGAWIIFVARFLPGLRAPLFLTAGSLKVSFLTFFAMDGLAALLSIPLSFWVAYFFTDRLQEVLALSHTALYWLLGVLVVGVIVGHIVWDRWRARRRSLLASAATALPVADPPPARDAFPEREAPAGLPREAALPHPPRDRHES
jgi:membrane protein DedA with SNARE-associated domain